MANVFNNINDAAGVIAKGAAAMLKEELQFTKTIEKADASDYEGKNGYAAGDTIYISKPARFVPTTAFDITSTMQDIKEEKVALTLDVISTVGVNINTLEMATDFGVKSILNRVIKPAVSSIAQDVDRRLLEKASDATFNSVGTPGSATFTTAEVLAARTLMNRNLAPKDDNRYLLMDSGAGALAVDARKGLFQSSSEVASQYKQGFIGMADGFKWMECEMLNNHTNGNDVTGAAMDETTASGASTIHIDGITTGSGTLKKGQIFTIANVYAVHPITKATMPHLQQFVITADVTASGASDADITISPTIYGPTSNGLQNVNALPVDDAAITFVGTASQAALQNLAYHKSAFKMASVPLVMPVNAEFAAQETVDGITVAIVRDFDVLLRRMVTRVDFLGGFCAPRPEWAVRLPS